MSRRAAASALSLVILTAAALPGPAAHVRSQATPGCEGQWLLHLTFEGRDVVEDAIGSFAADGEVILASPPVVPPLPGAGDDPLYVSDSVGSWREGEETTCEFEAVRLLAADDGVGIGAVYLRGSVTVDASGLGLDGAFTYDQSTALGQTVASGAGTLVGTSISG